MSMFCRSFHEAVFRPIREAAKAVAGEFVENGMKEFLVRWGDNIFAEGTGIKDAKQAQEYAEQRKADLEAMKRQAKIQNMYQNVSIP